MVKNIFTMSKAKIRANEIDNVGLNRQTHKHNAQKTNAAGNVRITVIEQYPQKVETKGRPVAGRVISGDAATVSSRRKSKVRPSEDGGNEIKVGGNVIAIVTKNGDAQSKNKGAKR